MRHDIVFITGDAALQRMGSWQIERFLASGDHNVRIAYKEISVKRKKGGAKATYEAIKYANPKLPSGLSDTGKSLLGGLIEKNFWNRLGENGGVEEIRSHQFFTDVNWDDVESESTIAPFYPSEIGKMKQKIDDSKKNFVEGKQKCGTKDADGEGKLADTRLEFGLVRGQKKYAKAFTGFDFVQNIDINC